MIAKLRMRQDGPDYSRFRYVDADTGEQIDEFNMGGYLDALEGDECTRCGRDMTGKQLAYFVGDCGECYCPRCVVVVEE